MTSSSIPGFGGSTTLDTGGLVGGYAADGWFKMFEFFEVPSQAIGAIGPVAPGSNFDWLRQDIKPGQLNLNLIMDEEVFFSVAGDQTHHRSRTGRYYGTATGPARSTRAISSRRQLLNFNQIQPGCRTATTCSLRERDARLTYSPTGCCPRSRARFRWW